MGKEIRTFGNTEIEKQKFHCYKNASFLKDLDIDDILIPNKTSSGEANYKYSVGYLNDNNYEIKPLHILLPKTSI